MTQFFIIHKHYDESENYSSILDLNLIKGCFYVVSMLFLSCFFYLFYKALNILNLIFIHFYDILYPNSKVIY
jgi:hypothetical protein